GTRVREAGGRGPRAPARRAYPGRADVTSAVDRHALPWAVALPFCAGRIADRLPRSRDSDIPCRASARAQLPAIGSCRRDLSPQRPRRRGDAEARAATAQPERPTAEPVVDP